MTQDGTEGWTAQYRTCPPCWWFRRNSTRMKLKIEGLLCDSKKLWCACRLNSIKPKNELCIVLSCLVCTMTTFCKKNPPLALTEDSSRSPFLIQRGIRPIWRGNRQSVSRCGKMKTTKVFPHNVGENIAICQSLVSLSRCEEICQHRSQRTRVLIYVDFIWSTQRDERETERMPTGKQITSQNEDPAGCCQFFRGSSTTCRHEKCISN